MEGVLLTALGLAIVVLIGRLGWVMRKEERVRHSTWALIWMVIAFGVCTGRPAVIDSITLSNMISSSWILPLVLMASLVIAIWAPIHVRRRGGSGTLTFVLIGVTYLIGFYGWFDAACVGC